MVKFTLFPYPCNKCLIYFQRERQQLVEEFKEYDDFLVEYCKKKESKFTDDEVTLTAVIYFIYLLLSMQLSRTVISIQKITSYQILVSEIVASTVELLKNANRVAEFLLKTTDMY
jgi:hypothetical protein